jgi:SAM-dependent methyltransferase
MKTKIKKTLRFLFNNVLFNNLMILLGLENKIKRHYNIYVDFKPDPNKSLQEIAGFSNRPEINEVLSKIHQVLIQTRDKYLPNQAHVLDIGCGPGLYLKNFPEPYFKIFAIDINKNMLEIAKRENPTLEFFHGDFISTEINEKFNLIYSIGMLCYIARNDIEKFFVKVHQLLEEKGIVFISYPHAISKWDLFYPDLSYIQYSPGLIESIVQPYFNILQHEHILDGRKIQDFDKNPYPNLNQNVNRTYRNSYLLVAQKK